jgi:hypothetical protein
VAEVACYHFLMGRMAQIDIKKLYDHHEQLLGIEARLEDLLSECGPAKQEVAPSLQALTRRLLDQLEDVPDSDESRAAVEDVKAHGAVPWSEVEAELGK